MALIVQKYGGSSLATPEHIRRAAERIEKLKKQGVDLVIVVSAMGRMTDHLISLAERTVANPPKREMDMLLTAGERVSMSLLSMALLSRNIPAISFTGSQSGIITTPVHTEAKIIELKPLRIQEELKKGKVIIIAGFQGVSLNKEITTLGRGGSDTTAVALAAALKADECQILTDVDGIFTADPRIVPNAKLLSEMPLDKALEFSRLGAKMHPRSLALAKEHNVRVRVSHSQKENAGTLLAPQKRYDELKEMEQHRVEGIATKDHFSFLRIPAPLNKIQSLFSSPTFLPQFLKSNEKETIFLVSTENEAEVLRQLTELGFTPECKSGVSLVSLVGNLVGMAVEIYRQLHLIPEPFLLVSENAMSFSVAVDSKVKAVFAQHFHKVFLEGETKKAAPVDEAASSVTV